MRIQYMSNLHMELYDNSRYIKAAIERVQMKAGFQSAECEQARPKGKAKEFEVVGDVLVLAGDTFYLRDIIAPQKRFWNWASENFRQVLLVPGNHEFYSNSDVTARGDSWQWISADIISGGSPAHGFRSKRSLCYRTGKLYCRQSH